MYSVIDDLSKGLRKIKQAEVTSNLSSDEDNTVAASNKRFRRPPKRLFESDSEDESRRGLLRPPIIKLKSRINNEGG